MPYLFFVGSLTHNKKVRVQVQFQILTIVCLYLVYYLNLG
jgi:hypothetical protein